MTQDDTQHRQQALIASMTDRLRPLCQEWPEEEFKSMVEQLAAITLKYEGQSTVGTYDRRTTDRLLAELKESLEHSAQQRRMTPGSGDPIG